MKKKKLENTILTVLGIGLIVTSIVLLLKDRASNEDDEDRPGKHYLDYGESGRGLHVFSETGILL